MQLALKRKVHFNYRDYLELPYDKRYEIIDGDLHMTPAPLTYHQKITRNIYLLLWEYVKKNNLGELLFAPVDVVFSNEDIVQPDIVFISKQKESILTEENIQGVPDLIIEVLSPSTRQWDKEIKLKLYEKYGVREYWIVDPEALSVEVYHLIDEGLKLYRSFTQTTHLRSLLLKNLKILIDAIFKR